MSVSVYSRALAAMRRIGMGDRVRKIPCRYGYEYMEVSCENREERELVGEVARRIKGAELAYFFPGIHDSIGVIQIHDAEAHAECLNSIRKEMQRVEEWWQRYHAADEETRRLMACGKIQ